MFVETSFFPPSSSFVCIISLFIKLKYEVQGYLNTVSSYHFKAMITNRSFRPSPEVSPEGDTKHTFILNDYCKNEF